MDFLLLSALMVTCENVVMEESNLWGKEVIFHVFFKEIYRSDNGMKAVLGAIDALLASVY